MNALTIYITVLNETYVHYVWVQRNISSWTYWKRYKQR